MGSCKGLDQYQRPRQSIKKHAEEYFKKVKYRISSYSFHGNYSFLNSTLCTVTPKSLSTTPNINFMVQMKNLDKLQSLHLKYRHLLTEPNFSHYSGLATTQALKVSLPTFEAPMQLTTMSGIFSKLFSYLLNFSRYIQKSTRVIKSQKQPGHKQN